MGVLADHLLVVSGLTTTTYLCWLCRSPPPDKEDYFVCLLAVTFSTCYDVCALSLSLSIPHGMHLVVLTDPCFFWVACYPNRTFPPKEFEEEPRIVFFFSSPHYQTMPSDPWPTISYIGWVQAGGARVSCVLHLLHPSFMHLLCSGDWSVRFAVHFWLLMAWVVFRSAILYDLLLLGIGPCWIMGLPSLGLFYVHFVALLVFSCRTTLLFLL